MRPSHGYRASGAKVAVVDRATPSASTPAVCVTATVAPRPRAWPTVPCWPTMYAAITVLP